MIQYQVERLTVNLVPAPAELDLTSSDHDSFGNSVSPERESQSPQDLFVSATSPEQILASQAEQEHRRSKSQSRSHGFVSPFKDCVASFGKQASRKFSRPTDGTVNSYIKFNWPQRRTQAGRSSSISVATEPGNDADDDQAEEITRPLTQSSSALVPSDSHASQHSIHIWSQTAAAWPTSQRKSDRSLSFSGSASPSAESSYSVTSHSVHPWSSHGWANHSSPKGPRMLPSHFGMVSKMDKIDRQLWAFCRLRTPKFFQTFHISHISPLQFHTCYTIS